MRMPRTCRTRHFQVDIANLEEQLATAKAHLAQKNATIDLMMREQGALEEDMRRAKVSHPRGRRRGLTAYDASCDEAHTLRRNDSPPTRARHLL